MRQKLLTVAVPAYNAENYLNKCLDSFCRDDVLPCFDIIVVNDGSWDRTSEIAHTYADRYPQSFRVIDKENGGHGSGINCAIQEARGKYFQTVDSDDWVVTENLPELVRRLEQADEDILLCHYHMVDMKTGRKQPFTTDGIPLNRSYTVEEFMSYPQSARRCCYFHGIIYRTEFYRGLGIRLSEHTFYEDQEYATIPFYYAKRIKPLDIFVYQYLVGNASQSISNANQGRYMGQIENILRSILRFYDEHGDMSAEKRDYFLFKLSTLLLSYYVAGLLKAENKREGAANTLRLHEEMQTSRPELARYTEKRYRVAVLLYRLHITADMLEKAKQTRLYYMIRKHL